MTDTPIATGPAADRPGHIIRTQSLSARKPTRFAFHPDAEARAKIAAELDLIELPALSLIGEIRPTGRHDFTLEARLEARAVQPCSVTLAPVPCRIAQDLRRRYDADFTPPEAEEAEMMDDEVDPLPETLDIAMIATEGLALALPLCPRAAGASLGSTVFAPPGVTPIGDADLKPFAGLASLAERLKKPGSGPSSGG